MEDSPPLSPLVRQEDSPRHPERRLLHSFPCPRVTLGLLAWLAAALLHPPTASAATAGATPTTVAVAAATNAAHGVILSEFMADNTRTIADEDRSFEDWIELRNTGSAPVNLAGWALVENRRRNRPWVLPGTNLPAGGHLLLWASGKDRSVPGRPLHTDFRLAASGEPLALLRPDGSVATDFGTNYPPQWPDASFGFLPGSTTAVFFPAPTPGRANELASPRPGPRIASIGADRPRLTFRDPLRIVASIVDATGPVTNVTLHWRSMFRPEVALPMRPDTNGTWSAILPAGAAARGQMIRWRVTARDAAGGESRYPLGTDPRRTSQYLGTVVEPEAVTTGTRLPVFHLFIPPSDIDNADSESGAWGCLFHDGEFYDQVFLKVRGNSTAGFPKRSHRLELPLDHPLRHPGPGGRLRHTSFMAEWGDPTYLRQHLSFWLQTQTGSAAPFHDPVRLQLNGAFWQLAMHSEVLGEELLSRHGLDPRGSLYKAVGTLEPDFNSTGGFEKKTRRHEGTEDYVALARALHESRSLDARRRALFDRLNLPAVINYLAVARLTQEDDDIWANMSLYHDNDGTGEWRPVPFDMNVSWGLSFASDRILATRDSFRSHPFFGAADSGATQGHNRLYDAIVRVPETRAMLLRRLRTVLDGWWQPPGTPLRDRVLEQHLAQLTNRIAPDAVLDRARWGNPWTASGNPRPEDALAAGVRDLQEQFIEPRRRHFYVTHSITNAGPRRPVGITCRDLAGIPLPQSPDARLNFDRVEHHADHPDLDFVRLANPGTDAVDISGWSLDGPVRFVFAPGTVVPAQGLLEVAANLPRLRAERSRDPAGGGRFVVGSYHGHLTDPRPLVLRHAAGNTVAESRPTAR